MVTLKGIGKKVLAMAFKLAESSCSCGGECGKCGACGSTPQLYTIVPCNERESPEEKKVDM